MAYRKVSDDSLTALADAIRSKTGGTADLAFPDGFISAVAAIEAGSGSGSESGGEATAAVQIATSAVTLSSMMLISNDGIVSLTGTSLTVPVNAVIAIYATAVGGSSSAAASINATATGGTVHYILSESSASSVTNAKCVILVRVTGDCNIAITRKTGSGEIA